MTDFAPTHVVPEGGMQAWSEPDPSQAPVANLGAGTELRVTEERGAWAAVLASNGWTGWVDGRRLATPPEPEIPPETVQPEPAVTSVMEPATPAGPEPPGPTGFAATHVVPRDGAPAWTAPDPGAEPVATLHPGTLLRLEEELGAWGRVMAGNGWSGWVDVRRLVVL